MRNNWIFVRWIETRKTKKTGPAAIDDFFLVERLAEIQDPCFLTEHSIIKIFPNERTFKNGRYFIRDKILFGSETGTAEEYAFDIETTLQRNGAEWCFGYG